MARRAGNASHMHASHAATPKLHNPQVTSTACCHAIEHDPQPDAGRMKRSTHVQQSTTCNTASSAHYGSQHETPHPHNHLVLLEQCVIQLDALLGLTQAVVQLGGQLQGGPLTRPSRTRPASTGGQQRLEARQALCRRWVSTRLALRGGNVGVVCSCARGAA